MSSGASTPRAIPSPAPGSEAGGQPPATTGGPSPLTIGKRFVKQYYQVLSSTPDQIYKFYQPTSVLSDGEGSSPADPVTFESAYDGESEKLKDRFFVKDLQIRFEFEHGAIDAQQSVNGGLIIVVTGHIVYFPSASEDEDAAVDDPIRKGFVHTFFLNALPSTTKKAFYVHNDILRFLKNPVEVNASISEAAEIENVEPAAAEPAEAAAPTPAAATTTTSTTTTDTKAAPPSPAKKQTRQAPAAPAPVAAKVEPAPETETISKKEEQVEEAPGGGVEETKEEPVEVPKPKSAKEEKSAKKDGKGAKKDGAKGGKGQEAKGRAKSPVAPSSPAPKPTPGSWASLVARTGGGATAPAAAAAAPSSSTVKAPQPPARKAPPKPAAAAAATEKVSNDKKENNSGGAANNGKGSGSNARGDRPSKRDPDCTLVLKNVAENAKESDIRGLFETFAAQTGSKLVDITLQLHRGLAFVDYDSINPVMKAVELHEKEPMRLFGRVLEVDQKSAEQRARRAAQQRSGGGGGGGDRSGGRGGGDRNRRGRDGRGGDRGGNRGGGGRGGRY